MAKAQETSSILRVVFALSKWPHLHREFDFSAVLVGLNCNSRKPLASIKFVCKWKKWKIMIKISLFLNIFTSDWNHFIIVKGTLPYQFDPDWMYTFSELEKATILYSIAKFNREMDGCLRIVWVFMNITLKNIWDCKTYSSLRY